MHVIYSSDDILKVKKKINCNIACVKKNNTIIGFPRKANITLDLVIMN